MRLMQRTHGFEGRFCIRLYPSFAKTPFGFSRLQRCPKRLLERRAVHTLDSETEARLEAILQRLEALEASFADVLKRTEFIVQNTEEPSIQPKLPDASPEVPVQGQITVCIGKDCKKQGSSEVLKQTKTILETDTKLQNVKLKTCNCLDECGKGPVISTKFGKAKGHKHKKVKPKNIESLISQELEIAQSLSKNTKQPSV